MIHEEKRDVVPRQKRNKDNNKKKKKKPKIKMAISASKVALKTIHRGHYEKHKSQCESTLSS